MALFELAELPLCPVFDLLTVLFNFLKFGLVFLNKVIGCAVGALLHAFKSSCIAHFSILERARKAILLRLNCIELVLEG